MGSFFRWENEGISIKSSPLLESSSNLKMAKAFHSCRLMKYLPTSYMFTESINGNICLALKAYFGFLY